MQTYEKEIEETAVFTIASTKSLEIHLSTEVLEHNVNIETWKKEIEEDIEEGKTSYAGGLEEFSIV